ncbi:MAG: glycosyltransferase family 4 protein [Chlorobi bacterium]|nr:glycosyltransferase family 4 protein [Chlorobiota bacterium]
MLANYNRFKKQKIDLFIGVESINAICGILMKKMGFVNTVVYYIFDWAPDRYRNPVMNSVYLFLDKIATYYSDYTWNITYTIGEAKKNILNYDETKMSPQLYVPYSISCKEDKILPDHQIDTNLVIYSGGLIEENGPQLLIPAFKLVLEKFPSAKLLIIGGGNIEHHIKDLVTKNDLQQSVKITGYIADEEEIMDLQRRGAIGVAPYPIIKGSRKPFGDVIKIRSYFACGLVTVSTPVPPVSKEIHEESLGYKTKDDSVQEIAKGISIFLRDKDILFKFRKNVIKKAKATSWEKTYTSSLEKMCISFRHI